MNVYLDNNVLVEIEYGNLKLSDFLSVPNTKYYFSPSHIEELIEGEEIKNLSVNNRLDLIRKLASTNCIMPGHPVPCFANMTPHQLYIIESKPVAKCIRNIQNSHATFNVNRDEFLRILRLNKIEINNIPPNSILDKLEDVMSQYVGMDINTYLKKTDSFGRSLFCSLFNLLDFACFYKDKQTKHSDIARMYDASHAFYAQICDIFISLDKRSIYKTKAVFSYLSINTNVFTVNDFYSHSF